MIFDDIAKRNKECIQVCRIYYKTKCKSSCGSLEYSGFTGLPLGYPESDNHFRERIIKLAKARTKE